MAKKVVSEEGRICSKCGMVLDPHKMFGFCSKCGDLLCLRCAYGTPINKTLTRDMDWGMGAHKRTINAIYPMCVKCSTAYRRIIRKSIVPISHLFLVVLFSSIIFFIAICAIIGQLKADLEMNEYFPIIFYSIVFAIIIAYLYSKYRTWKLDYDFKNKIIPGSLEISCPVCGRDTELALFITARNALRLPPTTLLTLINPFGTEREGHFPDEINCVSCNYHGPELIGIGMRKHVARYGPNMYLHDTFWEDKAQMSLRYPIK